MNGFQLAFSAFDCRLMTHYAGYYGAIVKF